MSRVWNLEGKANAPAHDGIDFAIALINIVPSIMWPALVVGLLWLGRHQLTDLIAAVQLRISRGEPVKLWLLELERMELPKGGKVVSSQVDVIEGQEDRQKEIQTIYGLSRNLLLVDISRSIAPKKGRGAWEVFLFVQPHYFSDRLDEIGEVEYALDTGWGPRTFRTSDRGRSFAMRFVTYGSVLCTAKLSFIDDTRLPVTLHRYVYVE